MKTINTPQQAADALNIPLTLENTGFKNAPKTKKKAEEPKKSNFDELSDPNLYPQVKPKRAKRPGEGRPAKTLKDLPSNWKNIIMTGSLQGKTEAEIRRDIVIAKGKGPENITMLWYALKNREQEFLETLNMCQGLRRAWWEEQGRKCLKRRFWQGHTWFSIMKNCFGYQDKTEINHGVTDETFEKYKSISVQDLQKKLDELMPNRVVGLLK